MPSTNALKSSQDRASKEEALKYAGRYVKGHIPQEKYAVLDTNDISALKRLYDEDKLFRSYVDSSLEQMEAKDDEIKKQILGFIK